MYLAADEVVADVEIGQCLVQPHVLHQVCRLERVAAVTRVFRGNFLGQRWICLEAQARQWSSPVDDLYIRFPS